MTLYNDPLFSYNAPIPYNGVVVPPVPPISRGGGGVWDFRPHEVVSVRRKPTEEEEAILLILTQMLVDEE